MVLTPIDNEQQARVCGRARANDIFRPVRWKRIGTLTHEAAKLYEHSLSQGSPSSDSGPTSRHSSYTVRAVKVLRASLAEVEAVLTGHTTSRLSLTSTRRRRKTKQEPLKPSLLTRLLPLTFVSGGPIVQYPTLEHASSERETVGLQCARVKPFRGCFPDKQGSLSQKSKAGEEEDKKKLKKKKKLILKKKKKVMKEEEEELVQLESVENHVLLEYTLLTKLQRSNRNKKATSDRSKLEGEVSVPSLLHLYRSVRAPTFGEQRPDFQQERLARDQVSITYIIQDVALCPMDVDESSEGSQNEVEQMVTLEVVLTCSMEMQSAFEEEETENVASDELKQRLRHDALCLTRLQPLIDEYRQEEHRRRSSSSRSQLPELQHKPKNSDPNLLRGHVFARGRTCGVCQRKFKPFAWKRHCETCEKLVCNQCLSVVTASPPLSRRKIRVCSRCLHGDKDDVGSLHEAEAEIEHDAKTSSVSCNDLATLHTSSESYTANVSMCPSSDPDITMLDQAVAPGTPSRVSGRVQIDLDLDPSLVAAYMNTSDRRRVRSPQSQVLQEVVVGPASDAGDSVVATRRNNRRVILFSHPDVDEGKSASAKSMSFRRAKVVLLDESQTNLAARRPLDFITPALSSAAMQSLCLASKEGDDHEIILQETVGSCADSLTMIQFVQLKTPEPNYELDFSWYNIFPKAPVKQTAEELARVRYLEVTGLKLDAFSLVFLRYDKKLEELARQVLKVASQWHACSVNIVGSYEVYCLLTAYNATEQVFDGDRSELAAYPMPVDDVVLREESVSAYAVHHQSPFFVSEMKNDIRFQAHPLHTEQGAVSLLSFPIYSSGVGNRDPQTQGNAYCVATLDLWRYGHVPASSHVSPDWMINVKNLLDQISTRLEALALESHAFAMPRARAYHSLGSLREAKDSTRRANSVIDRHGIDSEFAVDGSRFSEAETMDQLTNLSYVKVRGPGLSGMTSSGSSTWKYDSDNESTTSSQSASSSCSQGSRFSSYYFSAADMHSTIESLLQQASKTSQYINETGVSI
uniref:FYVE-type domain-containing protein n=1 Tax=Hyaloperonospora arabidopsidis (strain Emoy2) TaxID=559515 RepID=M4BL97_HYAAE